MSTLQHPLTPFHLGPALLFATLFPYLEPWTFLMANIVVDLEPFLVMVFDLDVRWEYPLHGYLHTLPFGAVVALALAWCMSLVYRYLGKPAEFRRIAVTALLGVWLHVILDSFLYTDIRPLFPSDWNPLYGLLSTLEVYSFCVLVFLVGVLLYLSRKFRTLS